MVHVDASATSILSITNHGEVGHTQTLTSAVTLFEFLGDQFGTFDWVVRVHGTGFTYDGSAFPTAGTVTSIEIDTFGPALPFSPEIVITGLSVQLTDLVIKGGTRSEQTDAFWSTILSGDDLITGGDNITNVFGDFLIVGAGENLTGGNDTINATTVGTNSNYSHYIMGDADQVDGGTLNGGNDKITVDSPDGNHLVCGDTFYVAAGATLNGGNDRIIVHKGVETELYGEALTDFAGAVIVGGRDRITGSNEGTADGSDSIFGDLGSSSGDVTGGNDRLIGRGGHDLIVGDVGEVSGGILQGGNDFLSGGGGRDKLFGDVQTQKAGATVIGGNDTLNGGNGNDLLIGGGGRDVLNGDRGIDRLKGGTGNDILLGGDGNDRLDGQNGNDTLGGGAGNDVLTGGRGRDVLTGHAGIDTFDFNLVSDSNTKGRRADTITDFVSGVDLIDLSGIDAIAGAGNQAFTFIGTSGFSGTSGELRAVTTAGKTIVRGDTDGDSKADLVIELTGTLTLGASDFVL
ncbi:MAG: hypothetical protein GJ676_22390 [Rhodobacteraceae bacterium]|nr:hypothetical protein [Paracoccaceae bacterium]